MRLRPPRVTALLATGLALTIAAPAAAQAPTGPSKEARVAIAHLEKELGKAALAGVVVTDEYTSKHNGVTHVYLRQARNGTPVVGAEATVNVQDGKVILAGHRFVTDAGAFSGQARLAVGEAVQAALRSAKAEIDQVRGTPRLAYRVLRTGKARLAYQVEVETKNHWWDLAIDAQTGKVVEKLDNVDQEGHAEVAASTARPSSREAVEASFAATVLPPRQVQDGSSYRVFPMPLESPNDGPRATAFNPADADASPFGWHDTDGKPGAEHTITRGNNVNAYADTAADNTPDPAGQPDGGSGLDFDHPIVSYDATPASYRDAAVDNLFYWNNVMHDVTFRYGFDEEAGNFQQTNYSAKGKGRDAVLAEAQDGSFVLNANFATPAEGQPGRMQMFLWADVFENLAILQGNTDPERQVRAYSAQVRDGDLDAGVIAHEYGHGISNRLVGGPSTVNCLRAHDERQGEGWSDWWSYAMTMRPTDDGRTPRGIGTYVVYQDEGRSAQGIRITPYSTDMRINPSTLNTIRTAAEPHGVGYVWATMLWDLYWNLVEEHGFNPNVYESWETGGNNLAIQLVVDGMKMVACEPGFVDNRDAIIASDAALTDAADGRKDGRGENFCLIWRTFARRGLPPGA
jgi:hypothetical protein